MNTPKVPTDRSFGLTFAVLFALLGGWLTWRASRFGVPLLGVAGVFLVLGLALPRVLHPLNLLWLRFGMLLHKVVSPLMLGVIFFGLITPVALVLRAKGKDSMHRAFDKSGKSYWIDRDPPPGAASFPRQF